MNSRFFIQQMFCIVFSMTIGQAAWSQSLVNGRLVFPTKAAYLQKYNQLSAEVDAYVEPNTEIPANTMYEPYPMLANYENQFPGYVSIRKAAMANEYQQLQSGLDPEQLVSISRIPDPVAETFFNSNHVMQVADTIFLIYSPKILVKILHNNERLLQKILNHEPIGPYQGDIIFDIQGGTCEPNFTFSSSFLTNNTGTFTYTGQPNTPETKYTWDFGDGTTSMEKNPTKTYATSGVYSVCLLVENDQLGCFKQVCKTVIVNESCYANFSFTETGTPGLVCFTDKSSTINGTIISRSWSFGDGQSSNETNPCHTYPCDGEYNASLTITTSTGCTRTITIKVKVSSYNCCDSDIDQSETQFWITVEEGKRKIKGWAMDYQWWFFSNVQANLIHYKKWAFGYWIRSKSNLKAELRGNVYLKDERGCTCETPYEITAEDSGYASRVIAKKSVPQAFKTKREDPWVASFYEGGVLRKTLTVPVTCD